MDEVCPIDAQFAAEITALLTPPSPQQAQEYFDQIISKRQCRGIIVKQNGEYGKGVFADMDFSEEELIMKDQMLVGAQHSSNKIDCLVCSCCFRFIGSIQLQIGRRFYLQQLGISNGCCQSDSSDCDDHDDDDDKDKSKFRLPAGVVESLVNEEMPLPYSDKFCLPPALPCPGGCDEAYYCSKSCDEADWESSHSLLCTGERSESVSVKALLEFINHANETNDIFVLAAKAMSSTILRYRKLKATRLDRKGKAPNVPCAMDLSLLLEAWKPISMGHKRRWWDCIALPVDVESSDEATFRMRIRSMAYTSLKLLKAAIFDKECEPLFSLEIYGHIIGMFELNNLDLVVASPVEDYFLYIDELPYAQKKQTEEITRPLFDALGDDYSVCCQGTAFFPLQSCMNHSCSPNAKAFKRDEDKDGQATIVALKPICKGEEVTISYIDEDLPFEERQTLLADYGFRCRCPKCLEEEPRHSYS